MKITVLSGRFARVGCGLLLFSMLLAPPKTWSQKLPAQLEPVSAEAVPFIGTFRSFTLNQPPLPFLPFSELPVYALPDGSFVYDDRSVDYNLLLTEAAVLAAAEAAFGPETMSLDEPSAPGLKLTIPAITNGVVFTSIFESDTNSAYDLFEQLFSLQPGAPWMRVGGTEVGETNFAVVAHSIYAGMYRAADTTDSDFDGLPDAVETLELGLNPLSADSDGDGIPDGAEIAVNGWPHAVNYKALTRAVIFTSRPLAYEGGQSGEWTILLPTPAPAGGAFVTLHLGGYTDLGYDYLLAANGGWVTNEVLVPAGQRQVAIQVQAVDNTVQESRSRRVQAALIAAGSFPVDPELAEVALVDNDGPTVSVLASDAKAGEPTATNSNPGEFYFLRDGSNGAPLTVYFTLSGTAGNGVDYTALSSPVTIPADSNSVTLTVSPIHDTIYEGSETVVATLVAHSSYTINPV